MTNTLIEILKKQKIFFSQGNTLNISKRIEWLKLLKKSIKENEENLLEAARIDLGRTYEMTKMVELDMLYQDLDEFIEKLPEWSKTKKVDTPKISSLTQGRNKFENSIIYVPHGQVYLIVPFNFPIVLGLSPLAGSIIGGNVTLYNTTSLTPNVNVVIKTILSILPMNLVYCLNEKLDKLELDNLNDYPWDFIFFTGSTNTAARIYSHQYKNFLPVVFELGGKSPMIIDKTADIEYSAKKFLTTKMINAGQICTAVDYLIIHKEIEKEFIDTLKKIYFKEFHNEKIYESSLINKRKADEINNWIKNEDKNKFVIQEFRNIKGYEEIKFALISYDDVINKEYLSYELFSPISYYHSFDNLEDIMKIIENNNFPLALYLFSKDLNQINYLKYNTKSGAFVVNDVFVQAVNYNLPFGGIKYSGIGRYHGKYTFYAFTIQKPVVINLEYIK